MSKIRVRTPGNLIVFTVGEEVGFPLVRPAITVAA